MNLTVLDLFAGTGVGVACQQLGIKEYGVEIMPAAIQTREANGMETIFYDVWDGLKDPTLVPEYNALWASPPCQTFSLAGRGAGRDALDNVLEIIDTGEYVNYDRMREHAISLGDERTALVLTPLTYIERDRPIFVVLEQVPPVLPVWERYAEEMKGWGYSVWTGYIHAEQYGVPQTRKRAYLIARRDGVVAEPPVPTHSKYYQGNPSKLDVGVLPWVSMYEALAEPVEAEYRHGKQRGSSVRSVHEPAPTQAYGNDFRSVVLGDDTSGWKPGADRDALGLRGLSVDEAKALAGLPAGIEVAGTLLDRTKQLGNIVPPPVAKAILSDFMGGGE